ncbi:hypothetical protein O9992_01190 [Vibrio lentus]|nr:hypothetical protein [Vibrio lentus]
MNGKQNQKCFAYAQDAALGLPDEQDNMPEMSSCMSLVLHYIEELKPLFDDIHQRVLSLSPVVTSSPPTHHPFADFECTISGNYYEREFIQKSGTR